MPKRMLQLIGGLLTVAALAVAPAAATASDSSTAKASGSGGGGGCQDNSSPQSSWGNGWYGHDNNGPYWRGWGNGNGNFGGQSWDNNGCNGNNSNATAARVGRVMVSARRLQGSQCQHLSRSGNLGRLTTNCGGRVFRASGTRHWSHQISNPLPKGRYRLTHRAIDTAGNRGRMHVRHLRIR